MDEPKQIEKKIKSAVTDSEGIVRFDIENKPGVSNLLSIYSIVSGKTIAELETYMKEKDMVHLKEILAEVVIEYSLPDSTKDIMNYGIK